MTDDKKAEIAGKMVLTAAGGIETPGFQFQSGDIIGERFRVHSVLGRGGMGVVYRVEHIFLNQHMALKTIEPEKTSKVAWQRFQKEAQAASILDHANLTKIHDFGLLDGMQPFFTMQLIEGEPLSDLIKRNGSLPLDTALKIFIQAAFALDYAHSKGVVHRDIKPSNIMVVTEADGSPFVKIVDFGIARLAGAEFAALTATGEIFGTPSYMSPEQCLGSNVDERSDQYSLGCSMFEVLTGTPPFLMESLLSTMMQHRESKPPSLKEASLGKTFPPLLEQALSKTLEKDPSRRYARLNDFASDLMALQAQGALTPGTMRAGGINATNSLRTQSATRRSLQMRILATALVGAAITAIVVCLFWLSLNSGEKSKQVSTVPAVSAPPSTKPNLDKNVDHKWQFSVQVTDPSSGRKYTKFQFPSDWSLGIIKSRADGTDARQATGSVSFRSDAPLCLKASLELCHQPEFLKNFRPDDLSTFSCRRNENADDDVLHYLTHLTGLKRLELGDTEITDEGLPELERLTHLKVLYIDHCGIHGKQLGKLKILRQLEELDASYIHSGSEILNGLQNSPNLRILYLFDDNLTDNDMAKLSTIKRLRELEISDNAKISSEGISLLSPLSNLYNLRMGNLKHVSGKQVAKIASLRQLIELNVNHIQDGSAVVAGLQGSPNIEMLRLVGTGITDDDLLKISKMRNLQDLHIGDDNKITAAGIAKLETLPNLKVLKLVNLNDLSLKPVLNRLSGNNVRIEIESSHNDDDPTR